MALWGSFYNAQSAFIAAARFCAPVKRVLTVVDKPL